ncbi:type III secretion system outer membrane ring subunit SctC [Herbaspirillum sp. YR522]|uniref:type III secretion system outer membrane ring subunit SctC n=1 Tax=Herbaspirillum sp. YR522 TaxID=1144342 RepID=UPI00026FC4FC|nr:type III secretion system outer membrane ring subunit SctC [Herbaspirillum sp. YR522]EJN02567.1 type III secretion outer membrane pore, YscC/HrcC family [Herbaspirillum sp. YR522]
MAAAVLLTFSAALAHAAPIPWHSHRFNYRADGTPLRQVLADLIASQGLSINIDASLNGKVSGVFSESAPATFEKLLKTNGLVAYFDGKTVHVSSGAEIRERIFSITPLTAADVRNELARMNLDEPQFPLRFSQSSATLTAPAIYGDMVALAIGNARQHALSLQRQDQTAIRVFPLKHALAQDTTYQVGGRDFPVPGVASLLRTLMAGATTSAPATAPPGGNGPLPGLAGQGLAAQGRARQGLAPSVATMPGGTVADMPAASAPPAESTAQVVASRANITADVRTNSVLVYDTSAMMPHYERTIALLDRPQDLVEIEAEVIELEESAAERLGVQWSGRTSLSLPGMNSAAASLSTIVGSDSQAFQLRLHALQTENKARITSRPRVLTLNNSQAVIGSQQRIHVRVAGERHADLYPVDAGLALRVTPLIVEDGAAGRKVRLSIQIDDGDFSQDIATDNIPSVRNNYIATQAVVGEGDSLLIGGYHLQQQRSGLAKIPLLGDIPLIGGLFRFRQDNGRRVERLFRITPRLAPALAPEPNLDVTPPEVLRDVPDRLP